MSVEHPSIAYRAFLFDMDGTLLNSVAATERIWTRWAMRHGLDVAKFLPTIHACAPSTRSPARTCPE